MKANLDKFKQACEEFENTQDNEFIPEDIEPNEDGTCWIYNTVVRDEGNYKTPCRLIYDVPNDSIYFQCSWPEVTSLLK